MIAAVILFRQPVHDFLGGHALLEEFEAVGSVADVGQGLGRDCSHARPRMTDHGSGSEELGCHGHAQVAGLGIAGNDRESHATNDKRRISPREAALPIVCDVTPKQLAAIHSRLRVRASLRAGRRRVGSWHPAPSSRRPGSRPDRAAALGGDRGLVRRAWGARQHSPPATEALRWSGCSTIFMRNCSPRCCG